MIDKLQITDGLSVLHHFVGLALKGLRYLNLMTSSNAKHETQNTYY